MYELKQLRQRVAELEVYKSRFDISNQALQLAHAELNQIFQTAADGMRVIDRNFNVLRTNKTFCKLVGISMREGQERKCYDVFFGAKCHTPECPLSLIINGRERVECDVEKKHRNGQNIPCILTATAFRDPDGQLIGIVEHFKDIRERKKMELEILRSHSELENRVKERTRELSTINKKLESEISERKKKEKALEESEKDLHFLSSKLINVQEDERKRIAFEVHDGLIQSLNAIKIILEVIHKSAESLPDKSFGDQLMRVLSMVKKTVKEADAISKNLWPPVLQELGILATIRWFCREFEAVYNKIQVKKHIRIQESEIPRLIKIVIFRIIQESFNNAAKHGQCDFINLSLDKKGKMIELIIEDHGVGFDIAKKLSVKSKERGIGLISMKERVVLSGGTFSIESNIGSGTIVRAAW